MDRPKLQHLFAHHQGPFQHELYVQIADSLRYKGDDSFTCIPRCIFEAIEFIPTEGITGKPAKFDKIYKTSPILGCVTYVTIT